MHQGAPADNDADDNSMSADNDAADTPIQRWQTPANDTDSETKHYGYPFKCYVPPLTAALDDDDSDDSGVIY